MERRVTVPGKRTESPRKFLGCMQDPYFVQVSGHQADSSGVGRKRENLLRKRTSPSKKRQARGLKGDSRRISKESDGLEGRNPETDQDRLSQRRQKRKAERVYFSSQEVFPGKKIKTEKDR